MKQDYSHTYTGLSPKRLLACAIKIGKKIMARRSFFIRLIFASGLFALISPHANFHPPTKSAGSDSRWYSNNESPY
jgi:hypothetical protein